MTSWQLQEAKARFSELIQTVQSKGPQSITLHGKEKAVVLSKRDYDRLRRKRQNLVDFFRDSPFHGIDLKIERNRSTSRRVDL